MRPTELTPGEIADFLDTAFQHERGGDRIGLTLEQRMVLADYLGCHEEVRAAAWDVWQTRLEASGTDLGDAEYWLDVEFIEPCPQEREA
ncbi:hypothetical protein [Deinococcus apachensis]|uniref:hypothetical protein n=1 Tax=Deinococcus apachensis TaxID=309886 RepID=UPI0003720C0B|nr:hypothetical protein [Deinococcus apachensis]